MPVFLCVAAFVTASLVIGGVLFSRGCNPDLHCPLYTVEMGALQAYVVNRVPCPKQVFGVELQKGPYASSVPHPSSSPRPSGCVKYVGSAYYSSANCSMVVTSYCDSRATAVALAPLKNDVLRVFISKSGQCHDGPLLLIMSNAGLGLIIVGAAFPFLMAVSACYAACSSCPRRTGPKLEPITHVLTNVASDNPRDTCILVAI